MKINSIKEFILEVNSAEVKIGMRFVHSYAKFKVIKVGAKMSTCEYTARKLKGRTKKLSNKNILTSYNLTQSTKVSAKSVKDAYKAFMIPKNELIAFSEISVAVDQLGFCVDDWETCLTAFDLDDNNNKVRDKNIKDKQDLLRKQEPKLQKIYQKELKKITSKYPLYQKVVDLLDSQNLGFQLIDDVYIKKNSIRGNSIILLNSDGYAPINKERMYAHGVTRDELVGIIQSFRALDRGLINDYSYLSKFLPQN